MSKIDVVAASAFAAELRRLARQAEPQPTMAPPPMASDESRSLASIARLKARRREVFASLLIDQPVLVAVISGAKRVQWNGRDQLFGPGSLVLFPAVVPLDVANELQPGGQYQALCITLERDLLQLFSATYPSLTQPMGRTDRVEIAVPNEPAITNAFLHAFAALLEPARYGRVVIAHRLLEVLLALASSGQGRWLWSPLGEDIAGRVRRLLLLDPGRDWSVALVAKQLGLSLATLGRRLRAGSTSLRRILEEVRMAEARRLLLETGEPVGTIARRCGYESASRFVATACIMA
ncbi:MAG TPA: AraC family transcriptional regulator [Dongiaceae bacterium]|nr:AraC family transcriptional regulator [Dongiaceae bacterium]